VKKLNFLFLLLLMLTVAACSSLSPEPPIDSNDARGQLDLGESIELETYIRTAMILENISGAAVAVVKNGQIVYSETFGVRGENDPRPILPDTQFMIGSTGKSLTTMMAASVVDEGNIRWDTPVQQIVPSFRVADETRSSTLTLKDLFCNCLGAPRYDLEILTDLYSPEDIFAQVSEYPLKNENIFSYSNQIVAVGGYVAAVAGGGQNSGQSGDARALYEEQMKQRVLGPIGMTQTTLDSKSVAARDNYAVPRGTTIRGQRVPMPLDYMTVFDSISPAGGQWSTLEDMTAYLITQMNEGVAPDGQQVVSAESLAATRTPQVNIAEGYDYGLGLFIEKFQGFDIIEHGGNTFGFTTGFAFIPEKDIGIVVLANAQNVSFNKAVWKRGFEILLGLPREYDTTFQKALQDTRVGYLSLLPNATPLRLEETEPFLGSYTDPDLGDLTLSLQGQKLFLDMGEWRSELGRYTVPQSELIAYRLLDPPFAALGFVLTPLEDGTPAVVLELGGKAYIFTPKSESVSAQNARTLTLPDKVQQALDSLEQSVALQPVSD
jgi:CubicO group peptidase (beta-lactamase class C family)